MGGRTAVVVRGLGMTLACVALFALGGCATGERVTDRASGGEVPAARPGQASAPARSASQGEAPKPVSDVFAVMLNVQNRGVAVDSDNDGDSDGIAVGVYLFGPNWRSVYGNGDLVFQLQQPQRDADGRVRQVTLYTWELPAERALTSLYPVSTGHQYRVGLAWPGRTFVGEGSLTVEYRGRGGSQIRSEAKLVRFTPQPGIAPRTVTPLAIEEQSRPRLP